MYKLHVMIGVSYDIRMPVTTNINILEYVVCTYIISSFSNRELDVSITFLSQHNKLQTFCMYCVNKTLVSVLNFFLILNLKGLESSYKIRYHSGVTINTSEGVEDLYVCCRSVREMQCLLFYH
jgi:hypothetical protein